MIIDHGPDGATATFNDARTHRFSLERVVDPTNDRALAVVALNPSTADAFKLDQTVTRCVKWTGMWGFGRLIMTNIFAFRSTYPSDLRRLGYTTLLRADATDPDGEHGANDAAIAEAIERSHRVLCAWGNDGALGDRWRDVMVIVREAARPVAYRGNGACEIVRIGVTGSGQPKHPLARGKHRVPDDVVPQVWR